jgi:hypothetical protein
MTVGPGQWTAAFGATIQSIPPPFEPPTFPSQCASASGSTLITSNGTSSALLKGAAGYTGSPRVTDASFAVGAADIGRFGHIFVGSGENNSVGGRIGVAVGDIGQQPGSTTLYIEFVRKSGSMPGCFVKADGLVEGTNMDADNPDDPPPSDDTWVFYPEGGVVLPALQAGRWYRIGSIAGRRNDGGISVTASWQDLTTLEQRFTSVDLPAGCTPTWWDTTDHRPQYGIDPKPGQSTAKALIADLFIRPRRF